MMSVLAAQDAGGVLLHIHQLKEPELLLFVVEKQVNVGTVLGLAAGVRRQVASNRLRAAAIG
jgi:hypothetical protein